MSRIVLTAFEPFKRNSKGRTPRKNMSLEILKRIDKQHIPHLESLVLLVAFDDFESEIDYIKNFAPDYILSLGESGRKSPELEKRAKNIIICKGSQDCRGKIIEGEPVIKKAPAYYLTNLPFYEEFRKTINEKIEKYVGKRGYKLGVSGDAGEYVCNFFFYKLLHEFKCSKTKVGFIHFPYSGDVSEFTDTTHLILDFLKEYSGGKGK